MEWNDGGQEFLLELVGKPACVLSQVMPSVAGIILSLRWSGCVNVSCRHHPLELSGLPCV